MISANRLVARRYFQSTCATYNLNAVSYARRGDQAATAPLAVRSVSKTDTGVSVATYDDLGPVSTLAFVVNAGSRHESPDALGVAHLIKNSLFRSVPGDNIVRTVREAELRGNTLYTSHSRESIVIATDFLRDDLVDVVPLLVNNLFNNAFQPYEFLDAQELVFEETEAALEDPELRLVDSLHSVAFRTGLGNSLYASELSSSSLKRSDVTKFIEKYFTADRIALVGSGVSHKDLRSLLEPALEKFKLSPKFLGDVGQVQKYYGGEHRINAGAHSPSHYAIVFPSASTKTQHGYATALVLRALMDGNQRTRYGSLSGSSSLLASCATGSTSVSAFNTSYSDAGLIGFYIHGDVADILSVAQRSIDVLKSVAADTGFNDVSLNRAKKAAIVDSEEGLDRSARVLHIGAQVLGSGTFSTAEELADVIGKVSKADLVKLAKFAIGAKASIVAHGDVAKLPFSDQFKF